MDSRFQILVNDISKYFQPGIDLILLSQLTAIDLQTSVCFGQVKFQNNFPKKIKGLTISVRCFAQNNMELEGIDPFEFMNLSVPPRSVFGTNNTILFPNPETVYFSIQILKVLFFDGPEFINDNPVDLMMIPEPEDISGNSNYTQYRNALNHYCSEEGINPDLLKYRVQRAPYIWQCACGTINPSRDKNCLFCNADLGDLLLISNPEYLQQIKTPEHKYQYIDVKTRTKSTIEKDIENIKQYQKSEEYWRNGLLQKIEIQNQSNTKLLKTAVLFLSVAIVLIIGVFVLL